MSAQIINTDSSRQTESEDPRHYEDDSQISVEARIDWTSFIFV